MRTQPFTAWGGMLLDTNEQAFYRVSEGLRTTQRRCGEDNWSEQALNNALSANESTAAVAHWKPHEPTAERNYTQQSERANYHHVSPTSWVANRSVRTEDVRESIIRNRTEELRPNSSSAPTSPHPPPQDLSRQESQQHGWRWCRRWKVRYVCKGLQMCRNIKQQQNWPTGERGGNWCLSKVTIEHTGDRAC
jgi:hypothetical protein